MDIRETIEGKILFIILSFKEEVHSDKHSETSFEIIKRHNLKFEDFKSLTNQHVFKSILNQIHKGFQEITFVNTIEYRPNEYKSFPQQANEFMSIVNNILNNYYASFSELDTLIYKLKEYNIKDFWIFKAQQILSTNFEVASIIEFAENTIRDYDAYYTRIMSGIEDEQEFDIEKSLKQRIEARHKGISIGVPIPLKNLQTFFDGWNAPDLIVVGARPGMGKTTFALPCAWEAARTHNIVFLSLEMSEEQLKNRLASNLTGIEYDKIKKGFLTPEEYQIVVQAYKIIKDSKLNIIGLKFGKIGNLIREAERLKRLGKIDMIIIDYLQLLKSDEKFQSREQEVSYYSRSLKLLAMKLQIPIMALAQLKRTDSARKPMLSDLRESGAIEQDADIVAFLHRAAYYQDQALNIPYHEQFKTEFIVAKGRETGTASFMFFNDVKNSKLSDLQY